MHGVLVPPGGRGGGGIRAWRSILDGILLNSVNFEFFANKIKKYRNVMVKKSLHILKIRVFTIALAPIQKKAFF
jgi:hypothetical protein